MDSAATTGRGSGAPDEAAVVETGEEWEEAEEEVEEGAAAAVAAERSARGQRVRDANEALPGAAHGPGAGQAVHSAHGGMLRAARLLQQELLGEGGKLAEALRAHPGYALVLTGHSLGAGLAALLAALLGPRLHLEPEMRGEPETDGRHVTCFAFASPAVVSLDASALMSHVTCAPPPCNGMERYVMVCNNVPPLDAPAGAPPPSAQPFRPAAAVVETSDVVPRFGLASSCDLRDALGAIHHEPGLLERISTRQAVHSRLAAAAAAAEEEGAAAVVGEEGVGAAAAQAEEAALEAAWARSLLDWLRRDVTVRM